jgi:hypothetical protein
MEVNIATKGKENFGEKQLDPKAISTDTESKELVVLLEEAKNSGNNQLAAQILHELQLSLSKFQRPIEYDAMVLVLSMVIKNIQRLTNENH